MSSYTCCELTSKWQKNPPAWEVLFFNGLVISSESMAGKRHLRQSLRPIEVDAVPVKKNVDAEEMWQMIVIEAVGWILLLSKVGQVSVLGPTSKWWKDCNWTRVCSSWVK